MTNHSKSEKSREKEEKNKDNSVNDDNFDPSISKNKFDWDFILEREWSRTKK
ncbi:MAG: hypothetical protein KGD74_12425 [Candidatus Lokiarchaeota archaeon]|nr:hypothetical protein [Candidatus Lokiarchaeota archaeon]